MMQPTIDYVNQQAVGTPRSRTRGSTVCRSPAPATLLCTKTNLPRQQRSHNSTSLWYPRHWSLLSYPFPSAHAAPLLSNPRTSQNQPQINAGAPGQPPICIHMHSHAATCISQRVAVSASKGPHRRWRTLPCSRRGARAAWRWPPSRPPAWSSAWRAAQSAGRRRAPWPPRCPARPACPRCTAC